MHLHNLTTKLSEQIASTSAHYRRMFPTDNLVRERFALAIGQATHFLLPPNGVCLDPSISCRDNVALMRLPDDIVAFEFRMLPDDDLKEGEGQALNRIALAWNHNAPWEPAAGFNARESRGDDGFFVAAFYEFSEMPEGVDPLLSWQHPSLCMFVPYDQTVMDGRVDHEMDKRVTAALQRDIAPADNPAVFRRCMLFPDQFRLAVEHMGDGDPNAVIVDSLRNLHDEYVAVTTALIFLSTKHADTITIDAPEKLNRKRRTKGKAALPDYRILAIRSKTGEAEPYEIEQIGPRRGVRTHFRRAHVRRLQDGRLTFVRHTIVNRDSSEGEVKKSYRIDA